MICKLFLSIITLNIIYASNIGSINGIVIDVDTQQPLIGSNIIIEGTDFGAACDLEGRFYIKDIPVGSYTVTVTMIGYSSISRANVNVYSQRQTPLKFQLQASSLDYEMVTVKAGFFEKAKDGIVSTQTIDFEEIRSDPAGVYDIQKMIQSLPSVVSVADQNNEIIVRGGGPGENLFIMDHLEIPNPNHFGEVGSGGGPINILNTEFVERIDFFAGGFPARYGDKQSSVMDVSLREGSYDKFLFDMEATMAGVGLLVEGPFADGKGSYIASFRQAFLKHIIKNAGITAVPEYWNSQTKFVYNINSKNKLIFNAVGGWDMIELEDENNPQLRGAENVDHEGYQYTAGLTFKSLFSKKGYYLFSIGNTTSRWDSEVYRYENWGKDIYFNRKNLESDNFIKGDLVYKLSDKLEISTGLNIKQGYYNLNESANPDTVFNYFYPALEDASTLSETTLDDYYELMESNPDYDYVNYYELIDGIPDDVIIDSENFYRINNGFNSNPSGELWKYSAYTQMKINLNKLIVTSGLRFDKVPFNNTTVAAPRLGASFSFTPLTKFNLAYGKFYQAPFYWMLMNPNNDKPLKHRYTYQQVVGFEHYLSSDIRATIEIYNKTYHNKPVYIADTTIDSLDERLGFTDSGLARAQGLEFFLQKKIADQWYGTFSYSLSESETKDPRSWNGKNTYYPSDYDYKNVITLIGGYKFKFRETKWYQRFRDSYIFPYVSWIPFMVSDQLEVSFRYRYSGGRPYTEKDYLFRNRRWVINPNNDYNTSRYNYYSSLDIMLLRRFNFKKINLTTFIDIQNVFNRDNEWAIMYLDDGTTEMAYQYKQFPVGGIIIEF